MNLDLSDWLGQHVYATGEYEAATSAIIAAMLPAGGCMLDVGANVGYFTLLGSRRVGPGGRVLAFEPVPTIRAELCRNVQLQRAANVTVYEQAASNDNGEVRMYVAPNDHRGRSAMRALETSSRQIVVKTARIDAIVPSDVSVDLVKLDVEGAEFLALLGMEKLLRRCHPDIVIEISADFLKEMGTSARQLTDWVLALGYRMYRIDDGGVVPLVGWSDDLPVQFNALFSARAALPSAISLKERSIRD